MDMDYSAKHAASLSATQARLATACPMVTWDSQERPIVPGSAVLRKDLGEGGFDANADFKFALVVTGWATDADGQALEAVALKSALLQTEIGYLGDAYKVDQVRIVPGARLLEVVCNSLTQGA